LLSKGEYDAQLKIDLFEQWGYNQQGGYYQASTNVVEIYAHKARIWNSTARVMLQWDISPALRTGAS
jgi:hypothetical protein